MSDLFLYLISNCLNFALFFFVQRFLHFCVFAWLYYAELFIGHALSEWHSTGWGECEFSSNWLHFGCEFFRNTRLLCSCVFLHCHMCYIGHQALHPCGLPSASSHSQGGKQYEADMGCKGRQAGQRVYICAGRLLYTHKMGIWSKMCDRKAKVNDIVTMKWVIRFHVSC